MKAATTRTHPRRHTAATRIFTRTGMTPGRLLGKVLFVQ
jgi:hypothetical protein